MKKFVLLFVLLLWGCSPVVQPGENSGTEQGGEKIVSPDEISSSEASQEQMSSENPVTGDAGQEPQPEVAVEPPSDSSPAEPTSESNQEATPEQNTQEVVQDTHTDAGVESVPEDVQEAGVESVQETAVLTCQERLDKSLSEIGAMVNQNLTCSENTDCTTVATSTGCRGACLSAVNQAGKTKVEATVQQIDQTYCKTYRADGCPYATPKCVAVKAFCDANRCTLLDCSSRVTKARETVENVRKQHLSCSVDTDCVLFFTSTNCAGACQAVVNKTGEPLVKAAITQVNKTVCENYQADGCPYATPGCVPAQAVCTNNQCAITR